MSYSGPGCPGGHERSAPLASCGQEPPGCSPAGQGRSPANSSPVRRLRPVTRVLRCRPGSPAGRPVDRSASSAACSRTAAAAWSTTDRLAFESWPAIRSASWAVTVVKRSSSSRTGTGASLAGQPPGEGPGVERRPALPAGQRRGQADDHLDRLIGLGELSEPGHVALAAGDRGQRAGQGAAGVAPGHADPRRSHVDGEPHALPHRQLSSFWRAGLTQAAFWRQHGLTVRQSFLRRPLQRYEQPRRRDRSPAARSG